MNRTRNSKAAPHVICIYRGRAITRSIGPTGEPQYSVGRTGSAPGGVDECLRDLKEWIDKHTRTPAASAAAWPNAPA